MERHHQSVFPDIICQTQLAVSFFIILPSCGIEKPLDSNFTQYLNEEMLHSSQETSDHLVWCSKQEDRFPKANHSQGKQWLIIERTMEQYQWGSSEYGTDVWKILKFKSIF